MTANQDATPADVRRHRRQAHGVSVAVTALRRTVRRLGLTLKKKSCAWPSRLARTWRGLEDAGGWGSAASILIPTRLPAGSRLGSYPFERIDDSRGMMMGRGLGIDDAVPARKLRQLTFRERSVRTAERLLAIANALDGMSRADAAAAAGMERRPLRDAVTRYNAEVWRASSTGRDPVAGLPSPTANWRCLPSGSSRARSKDRWRRPGRCRTSPRSLEERFGKTITPQSLSRLLRREGFSHQKARPVHPKASAKARAGFEKRLRNALNEVAAAHPDKRIVLWFQDEMRVGQKGRLCHRWWLKGERAPGRQDRRFSFTDLFDAARADGEAAFALVLPEVGTAAMQLFLDRFADTLLPDEHAVMVFDGAGWHGASALVIPPNVTLVPLPPYSLPLNPMVNPMARVWLSLRARHPSLRLLRDTEAIVDACCKAWNALVGEAGRLRSLCLQHWIRHVIQ